MKQNFKQFFKQWLFSEELKQVEEILRKADNLSETNEYFIKKGKELTQHQLNNQRTPYRNYLGDASTHAPTFAARHLGIKSLQWKKQHKQEARKWASTMNQKHGWRMKVGKTIWEFRKINKGI